MGGPTNGRASACRRRLAAKAKPRPQGRASSFIFHLASFYFSFGASSSPTNRALRPHHQPLSCHLRPSSASRYCHLVPSGHGGLCASSALGLAKPFCSHPDPSLPLTSCCSKLSSWRSRMGDGQVVGRLLSSLVDGGPFGSPSDMRHSYRTGSEAAPLKPPNRLCCRACSY